MTWTISRSARTVWDSGNNRFRVVSLGDGLYLLIDFEDVNVDRDPWTKVFRSPAAAKDYAEGI